jgi:hypothetical protein
MTREHNRQMPMVLWARDAEYDYWHAALYQPTHRVRYLFQLNDGARQYWFGEEGLGLGEPGTFMIAGYFHYAYMHQSEVFDTPIWAREAVVYQVFVDRYRQNLDLLAHVHTLVELRRRHQAWRSGDCITLSAEPRSRLFAFIRHCGDDVAIVAINAGRKAVTLDLPGPTVDPHNVWRDALSKGKYLVRDGRMIVDLEPWQGAVLLPAG